MIVVTDVLAGCMASLECSPWPANSSCNLFVWQSKLSCLTTDKETIWSPKALKNQQ